MKKSQLVLSLISTAVLIAAQTSAHASSHLITVSSTAFPTTKCYLDPIPDGENVSGLEYVFGSAPKRDFSIDSLKSPTALYSQDFQKVVQIQLDGSFDERYGGKVQMIMLHEFNTFSANDLRTIHLQVKKENGNWVAYIDENAGLVRFDALSFVAGKYGINTMTLSNQGTQVDAYDFTRDDLK